MVAVGRTPCCVPFCRRWRHGDPDSEFICWEHFKRIPIRRRRAFFRALAERFPGYLREQGKTPRWMLPRPNRSLSSRGTRCASAVYRLYDRLKRDAIERAL